jgi:hypothetical protein
MHFSSASDLYTDSQDVLVLSTIVSDCCTDGITRPVNYGHPLYLPSEVRNISLKHTYIETIFDSHSNLHPVGTFSSFQGHNENSQSLVVGINI